MGALSMAGNHEKSARIRPGQPVLVWLSSGRGWMLCDGNNNFLGIPTIPAITLIVSGVLVNSPGFNFHIQNKTRSIYVMLSLTEKLYNAAKCFLEEKIFRNQCCKIVHFLALQFQNLANLCKICVYRIHTWIQLYHADWGQRTLASGLHDV